MMCRILMAGLVAICWGSLNVQRAGAVHASQDPLLVPDYGKPAQFSLRGSLGFLQGEARELVFRPELDNDKLSELQWDLSGLAMGGIVLSGLSGRFGFNVGIWTALNQGDGEMKDYDWMVPGLDWTDYHRSEVDVENSLLVDLNATYLFWQGRGLGVRGVVGFKNDYWEWSDRGQEFIYSVDGGFRNYVGNFGGQNTIDYEQRFSIPYLGVHLNGGVGKAEWSAYALYSPVVSAEDKDHHILREIHFEEEFEGGDFYAVGLSGTYRIGKKMFVTGALEYQEVPEIQGDMYIVEFDETHKDSAGISNQHTMLSLAVGYLF